MSRRLSWAIALALTALTLSAAPAPAQQWRPVVRSCLADVSVPGCTTVAQFGGPWNVVVSPDGRNAYVAAFSTGAILVFNRDAGTGALKQKPGADGCITWAAVPGCVQAHAIRRPDEILVSANGRDVYVTSEADAGLGVAAAISTFTRNTATGVLTQTACINDNGTETCAQSTAVGGRGAVLSADQRNIYTLGLNTLTRFDRNTADGSLTPMGCFGAAAGCMALSTDPGGRQLALSPDGKQLYTPGSSSSLRIFNRDPATGALAPVPGKAGCLQQMGGNDCTSVPQIGTLPQNVVLSPDGRFAYLSHVDGVVTFARSAGDGTLAFRSCLSDIVIRGCIASFNTSLLTYMAVSPDGQDLVAVPQGDVGGFTAFARNAATGALAKRPGPDGCLTPDGVHGACRASAAVNFFGHIHFFGDGLIYAGYLGNSRVAVVKRDFYPVCQSRSLTVRRNTRTAIPLTCSDRNGDPVSRAIVQAPRHATLGPIGGSVFYNPLRNFAGPDSFTFRGIAAGLAGPPATVAVKIPAPAKKKRIRGVSLSWFFTSFRDHTVLQKLQLSHVPRGSRVRATCTLHGHRCGGRARAAFTKKHAHGTVSLRTRFVGVNLPVGARLTVTVTKPGFVGFAKILTMRASSGPKVSSRCLPPGSSKLRKHC
jgi:DNA-binding beta-propeller fold protein YncE